MKHLFGLTAISLALTLSACGDKKPAAPTSENIVQDNQVTIDVTPAYPPKSELMSEIAGMTHNQKDEAMAAAYMLVEAYGVDAAQELSNGLWAGNNGYSRNRPISAIVAISAYETEPARWSTLRAGIGYVNGLGVDKNPDKAIKILSHDLLQENSGGHYFLSKAYAQIGQDDMARQHLQIAADMGHSLAKRDLAN